MATAPGYKQSIGELADEEQRLRRELGSTTVEMDELLDELKRRYVALADKRDETATKLADVSTRVESGRRTLDRVTLPGSLKPWLGDVRESLAAATSSSNDDGPSAASLLRTAPASEHPQVVGLPPMTNAEIRDVPDRMAAEGGTAYRPTDQPAHDLVGRAFVPFRRGADLAMRPALADLAVVKCLSVGGRALASRRNYTPGDLIFSEAATLSFPTDPEVLAATGALPPVLRRSLLEATFGADGRRAMAAQRWDARLAVAVFAVLAQWVGVATRENAASDAPKSAPRNDNHVARRAVMGLACPLKDMDAAALASLDRFSRFVHAALPPGFRRFASDDERRAAVLEAQRRGVGESAAVSSHHERRLAEVAAEDGRRRAFDPVVAPYEENPLHQPVPVSPITGAAAIDAASTAIESEEDRDVRAALPSWCTVSSEDVARIMVIVQCNAVSGAAGGYGPATARAAAAAAAVGTGVESAAGNGGSASWQHLLYLVAALEHSCTPNALLVAHHLPFTNSVVQSYRDHCADGHEGSAAAAAAADESTLFAGDTARLFEVRALRPVGAGERLSISYDQALAPLAQRRSRLRQQYQFDYVHDALRAGAASAPSHAHVPLPLDYARCAFLHHGGSDGSGNSWALVAPHASTGRWTPLAGVLGTPNPVGPPETFAVDSPVALALLRLETSLERPVAAAGATVLSPDGVVAEADALSAAATTGVAACAGSSGLVPAAGLHFAALLRFMRVAAAVIVADPMNVEWQTARRAVLSVAICLLGHWCEVLARAAPSAGCAAEAHAAVGRLRSACARVACADAPVMPAVHQHDSASPIPHQQVDGTIRYMLAVYLAPLADHTAAVAARSHVAVADPELAGEVWAAARDVFRACVPAPCTSGLVRAAAMAAEPSATSLPPHLCDPCA